MSDRANMLKFPIDSKSYPSTNGIIALFLPNTLLIMAIPHVFCNIEEFRTDKC
jgi:hypothetical protein